MDRPLVMLFRAFPFAKKAISKGLYQFLAWRYPAADWNFMNYGFAALGPGPGELALEPADEADRNCIQLYHHVAGAVDLAGLEVLEVGSGRGGGASYIMRYLNPKSVVGLDYSAQAVALSNERHKTPGLSFRQGDAEALPFDDNSLDVVVNVESSHCYPSMEKFLAEVERVMRPGGHFLFTDFRPRSQVDALREHLRRSRLTLVRETDVMPHVIKALELDSESKKALIRKMAGGLLAKPFQTFAGTEGSKTHARFRDGEVAYLSFVLRKDA